MVPGIQSWDQFHISQLDLPFFGQLGSSLAGPAPSLQPSEV